MLIIIVIALTIIFLLIKPMSDGLFDTSMWVTKILAPPDFEEIDATKQFLKIGQAALMEGWLSNIPFIATTLFLSSIVVAFFYSWWFGILMFLINGILGEVVSHIFVRSVSYYLPFLYQKMLNRKIDYKNKNDMDRLEASESFCTDLLKIIAIYQNSSLKPPTEKQLKVIPYGDSYYWLTSNHASILNS